MYTILSAWILLTTLVSLVTVFCPSVNLLLNAANNESISVLPVYCFDPADYGKSSSGFDKTGPYRATFLIESVTDLRMSLQARGSDLVVRVEKPEKVLVELANVVGADAVYAHREVSHDEVMSEDRIEAAMKEESLSSLHLSGNFVAHTKSAPSQAKSFTVSVNG